MNEKKGNVMGLKKKQRSLIFEDNWKDMQTINRMILISNIAITILEIKPKLEVNDVTTSWMLKNVHCRLAAQK